MFKRVTLRGESSRTRSKASAVMLPSSPTPEPLGAMRLPAGLRERVESALGRPDVKLALGEATVILPEGGGEALVVLGLGERLDAGLGAVRRAAGALTVACDRMQLGSAKLHLPGPRALGESADALGRAVAEGASIAAFDYADYRGAAATRDAPAGELQLTVPNPMRSGFETGALIAHGVTTARRLAATPPNVANPRYLADHCRQLAREVGLTYREVDADEAARLGMGGLLAVGRGGSAPPRLIVLEHRGASRRTAITRSEPVLLVGKAVTFDTGGVSLKPTSSMAGMKYDMCGGAAVIGAMEAAARLDLPTPVVGLVPCAENLIDAAAYRVDDILTLCNGVTVEVVNTDAEGRLILADALAYGTRYYKPRGVIDLATLTGGVVTALGDAAAGLFVNDHELHRRLDIAGETTGERVWRLPLWDEHREKMRAAHADLQNAGDRKATAAQAAAFLSFFVGEDAPQSMPALPWAHLDIAGVAKAEADRGLYAKGPTGYGVRLVTRYLEALG